MVFLFLFLGLLTLGMFHFISIPQEYIKPFFYANGFLTSAGLAIILWFDIQKRKILHPIHLYYAGNILLIGFGAAYMAWAIGTEHEHTLSVSAHLPVNYLPHALLLTQLGLFMSLAGFSLGDSRRKEKAILFHSGFRMPAVHMIICVAIVAFAYKLLDRYGGVSLGMLGTYMTYVPKGLLFICTIACFESPKKRNFLICLIIIFFAEFFFAFKQRMREEQMLVVLPIVLGMGMSFTVRATNLKQRVKTLFVQMKKRKKKQRKALITVLMLSVVAAAFFVYFPAASAVKKGDYDNILKALEARIWQPDRRSPAREVRDKFPAEEFASRMAVLITSAAICIELRENGEVIEYDPLQLIAAGMVPRAIWPDKPIISTGGWFNRFLLERAGRYAQADTAGTSMALTAGGELFWAYGIWGVILGMAAFGWLVGKLTVPFLSNDLRNIPSDTFFIIAAAIFFTSISSAFSYGVSFIIVSALITWGTSNFFSKKKKSRLSGPCPHPVKIS